MPKRGYNSITGGTGDVNPQFMKIFVTQSAADTTTTSTNPIPIQRLPSSGRAQVMEILKIFWDFSIQSEVDSAIYGFLLTSSVTATPSEPKMVSHVHMDTRITTSGKTKSLLPFEQDMTDGVGHGVLVATDNLYLQCQSSATTVANTIYCNILYRWKNVGLSEYVGIVQSQQ